MSATTNVTYDVKSLSEMCDHWETEASGIRARARSLGMRSLERADLIGRATELEKCARMLRNTRVNDKLAVLL